MPGPGFRYRQPDSRCIAFASWDAEAMTVQSGKRPVAPGSLGSVFIIFRRKYPRYAYHLTRLFRFDEWANWMRSASPGKRWNQQYLGRV